MNNLSFLETIPMIISIISLVATLVIAIFTNKLNKKVNSRDYELSEKTKSDLLDLIATLRSIRMKIRFVSLMNDVRYNLSEEIKRLNEIKLSSAYLYLMHSIKEKERQEKYDMYYQMLTTINVDNHIRDVEIFSTRLLRIMKDVDIDVIVKYKVQDVYKKFASGSGIEPENELESPKESDDIVEFAQWLIKEEGINDPDVLLWSSIDSKTPDGTKKLDEALKAGANVQCTDKMIKEKYAKQYVLFSNSKIANSNFEKI